MKSGDTCQGALDLDLCIKEAAFSVKSNLQIDFLPRAARLLPICLPLLYWGWIGFNWKLMRGHERCEQPQS